MIKKWNQFIREFVESEGYINSKMSELKDLVDSATDGNNIIYEWENKEDHELVVTFSTGDISIKYDFDIDDLYIVKTAGNNIDFQTNVNSIEAGIEIIEKDIQSILGISESYVGEWSSSIKIETAKGIMKNVIKVSELSLRERLYESDDLISELEKVLKVYDRNVSEFVIDSILFCEYSKLEIENKTSEIIKLGDKVMGLYGTEPNQILNAFEDSFSVIRKYYDLEEEYNSIFY
jgi:hypothetical protein